MNPLYQNMKRSLMMALAFVGVSTLVLLPDTLQAQCTFNQGLGAVVSQDLDDDNAPFNTDFDAFSAALAPAVTVNTNMTITICFWGDMNNNNETFDVVIAGQTFSTGDFGFVPTQGSPACVNFVVNAANVQTDIADGDIDIQYTNFGGGWNNNNNGGDEFNAQVQAASFEFDINAAINNVTNRCQDGTNGVWNGTPIDGAAPGDANNYSIAPVTAAFSDNGNSATLDVSAADAGTYTVKYQYTIYGCTFEASDAVEIYETPVASLQDLLLDCYESGDQVDLGLMNDGTSSAGSFSMNPGGNLNGTTFTVPAAGGCFQVTFTADNPNGCPNGPYDDTEQLLATVEPDPSFSITGASSPACSDGGNVLVSINNLSNGPNQILRLDGAPINFGNRNLAAPANAGSITYTFELTETNSVPANCGSLPGANYTPCSEVETMTFTVYNDGIGCGANAPFASECPTDPDEIDACVIGVSNELVLACKFFSLPGLQVIEAKLDANDGVLSCSDESTTVDWVGSLPGALGNAITGGPTLAELGGVFTEAICFIITFEICIPLPIVDDICIDPIPLPDVVEDACDQTIGQFIFSVLSALLGGDGGGGYIVADTDGDGFFDQVLEDYDNFPDMGTETVPNNVKGATGTIIVRHVTGWPFKPSGVCGTVVSESIDLLDLLPIGSIPLIGPPVEDALAAAGCGVDLVFSDEKTIKIPVINNEPPIWANCNSSGYQFSEDLACDTEVNWSIPVANDGCYGTGLPYRGRTAGTDASNYNGTPPAVVTVTQSGVYQTAGPIPGSDLDPGTYTVTYTAYSCNGVSSDCTFDVVVTPGDPMLACPADMTFNNDVDQCDAVVSGLTPTSGLGCASIINYEVDYPAGTPDVSTNTPYSQANLGTHNDASGLTFPVGTSTVTYTMMVDINGDGDVNDPNETQTCNFTVTVVDAQEPVAQCTDINVQLDNTGSATVYAHSSQGMPYVDGGSTDNCDTDLTYEIAEPQGAYAASLNFGCDNVGGNLVNLRVTDDAGNSRICIANINIIDFFDGIQLEMDLPEICLEANNPVQLDFANYLNITLPDGTVLTHAEVANNAYLGDAGSAFGITTFLPHPGTVSMDPGSITADGIYTPGTGTGFVTVSYAMALPGAQVPQNGNNALASCFIILHSTFELRQPLDMVSPECACVMENERIVDLGVVTGGLEPYTIQYTDAVLDFDGDGVADDVDGEFTFDAAGGFDINDFEQDLGDLRVEYNPLSNWSFTIVDARGCEIFRSGSCDNDDLTEGPEITCPANPPILDTETYVCERHYSWDHPIPSDNCAVTVYNYQILNPDGSIEGPHTLEALLNDNAPLTLFEADYEFELGESVVSYWVEDAVGLTATCSFTVTVIDDDPPYFINCPYPDVVENAETDHCDAYVNFALPLAEDNCDMPVVTQIDMTGLTTGDRFPVGTTVMYWQAEDLSGNKDTCQVKVIVNDYWQTPEITCPDDVVQDNDLWLCGAEVFDIEPTVESPCQDNLAITYSIFADEQLTQRIECGVWDASGEFFDVGDSWVRYTVQNQPLLLISEVSQSGAVDQLEITNLGPSKLDLTCLFIERVAANAAADELIGPLNTLPNLDPVPLGVGEVMVFDFAFDGGAAMPACYTISYAGNIIDEVAVNGYAGCGNFTGTLNSSDVYRVCEDDSNDAADWEEAENCSPLTIGVLNPELDVMPDNGEMASLQSIPPNAVSCVFKVTIIDAEDPFCGKWDEVNVYNGGAINPITPDACNRSIINIADDCIIGQLEIDIQGTVTPANSTITLISPEGIEVDITEIPQDSIDALFAQKSGGEWILDVVPNPNETPVVNNWSLTITCMDTFDLADQTLDNDPGQCGANFTWTHPWFVDNCFDGTISVEYTTNDADCVPTGGLLIGKGGYEVTEFFCVGTTTVKYTLVDAAGNIHMCSFDVTVLDVEPPVVECPQDIYVPLNGGLCGAYVSYAPALATDNCEVVDTTITPPSGSWFEIGETKVTIVVSDEAGNTAMCMFNVIVIEHVPSTGTLICNDLTNVSLDSTCVYEVNADNALEGNDYHCYDDYIITITNNVGVPVGNTFDANDIGTTFTVTVLDPETGNTCWTEMNIEDKTKPTLTCPDDVTISCSEPTTIAYNGDVTIEDCSNTTTQHDDDVLDNGECGDPRKVITRYFIVDDVWGNQSICSQTITIEPFDLADVIMPADITIDCEDYNLNNNLTEPGNAGAPSINGAPIGVGGNCSASIGYWDEDLAICEGSFEIYRTWKVGNTCLAPGPDNPIEHVQRIRVKDFGGPSFFCPADTVVSVDPVSNCCATAPLPDVIISEGCSGIISLEAEVTGYDPNTGNLITFTVPGSLGDFPGNNYWNPDTLAIFNYTQCVPVGDYTVVYTAEDGCGNTSSCSFIYDSC